MYYRLSTNQKNEIAQNLIDFLERDVTLSKDARIFISNWILTGPNEKRKAFYDVWDIILKNYLPTTEPILYRVCSRRSKNGKIASFTSSLYAARRFSHGKGILIICDTSYNLKLNKEPGKYQYTFYPICDLLRKAKNLGGCGFSDSILNGYLGEEEYIMKIDLSSMYSLKWLE